MTYALLPPTVLFLLSLIAVSAFGLVQGPIGPVFLTGISMVVAVASVQILLDVFFPDFTLKVEFGSSKSGRGTGKLLTTMLSSMVMIMAMFFVLILPTTPLPGRIFPGMSPQTVTTLTRGVIVGLAVLTAGSVAYFGTKRVGRILTDM
jgi:hypothetical protein